MARFAAAAYASREGRPVSRTGRCPTFSPIRALASTTCPNLVSYFRLFRSRDCEYHARRDAPCAEMRSEECLSFYCAEHHSSSRVSSRGRVSRAAGRRGPGQIHRIALLMVAGARHPTCRRIVERARSGIRPPTERRDRPAHWFALRPVNSAERGHMGAGLAWHCSARRFYQRQPRPVDCD